MRPDQLSDKKPPSADHRKLCKGLDVKTFIQKKEVQIGRTSDTSLGAASTLDCKVNFVHQG